MGLTNIDHDLSPDELSLLLNLGERLTAELDLDTVLALVAEMACRVINAETLAVPIADPEKETFTHRAASGKYATSVIGESFPLLEGACGWVMHHQRPLLFGEQVDYERIAGVQWEPGKTSTLLVPMICRGKVIGGLSAMGKLENKAFNLHDQTVLTLFANQAGIAIENARLFQNLNEKESRLRLVLDSTAEAIYGIDMDGLCTLANPACLRMLGYKSESDLIGKHMHTTIHHSLANGKPLPASKCTVYQETVLKGQPTHNDTEVHWRSDGTSFPVEYWAHPKMQNGQIVGAVVTFVDISERKRTESIIEQYRTVIHASLDGFLVADIAGQIIEVNESLCKMLGYSRDELLCLHLSNIQIEEAPDEITLHICKVLETGNIQLKSRYKRKNGSVVHVEISIRQDINLDAHLFVFIHDISHIKKHEAELLRVINYDTLTGIPNRLLLADRMKQGIAQATREQSMMAVCYIDLDSFKHINDTMGHESGDQVLIEVARRIGITIRGGDTVARPGGDEFVILLLGLKEENECNTTLERLLAVISQPIPVRNHIATISASIGVSLFPLDNEDPDTLLRHADHAMYLAKQSGKNRFHIYDPSVDQYVRGQHESLERIRRALLEREFVLHYQPKVNMRTGEIIGAEALIRWQHPDEGLLSPAKFLPLIEGHPLSIEVGEWVINTALTQMELWQADGLEMPVSVNVSAFQLQQQNFTERLREMLAAHPNSLHGSLEIEVLETSALEDMIQTFQVIEDCRKLGVMFALDDFGTGYSSLTYLKRLPVTLLKIDQSFVRNMLDDPDDMSILVGILDLGAAFRRKVIAEGVETAAQGELLLQIGCDLAQGYGIARPMPAHEIPGWTKSWQPDPSWINLPLARREDFPVLFAGIDHNAWIKGIMSFFNGERAEPPQMNHHQCRFGSWLEGEGLIRHGAQPAFQNVELLHRQVHELAAALLELHLQGKNHEALARLDELYHLRNALLKHLKMLMQDPAAEQKKRLS